MLAPRAACDADLKTSRSSSRRTDFGCLFSLIPGNTWCAEWCTTVCKEIPEHAATFAASSTPVLYPVSTSPIRPQPRSLQVQAGDLAMSKATHLLFASDVERLHVAEMDWGLTGAGLSPATKKSQWKQEGCAAWRKEHITAPQQRGAEHSPDTMCHLSMPRAPT